MQNYPVAIEAFLAHLLDHFNDREVCLLSAHPAQGPATDPGKHINRLERALQASRLGFLRVVGIGRMNAREPLSELVEIKGWLVINTLKGSERTLPAFAEKMRDLAQKHGVSLILHRLRAGPVKLVEVTTGKRMKVLRSFGEALPNYFALVLGEEFRLDSLERVLSRANGSGWMAHVCAQAVGEMLSVADYGRAP